MRYTVYTTVENIKFIDGLFFVHFHGSRESLSLGREPPSFKIGDTIKITFEKVITYEIGAILNANPSEAPIE